MSAEGDLRASATEIYRRSIHGFCKGGKARQELTGVQVTVPPCKPYPMQHRLVRGITRLLGAPRCKVA